MAESDLESSGWIRQPQGIPADECGLRNMPGCLDQAGGVQVQPMEGGPGGQARENGSRPAADFEHPLRLRQSGAFEEIRGRANVWGTNRGFGESINLLPILTDMLLLDTAWCKMPYIIGKQ